MNAKQIKLARKLLGLNQSDFAARLGWTTKRNIVSIERGDKEIMIQTALAIECLLRRSNKFGDFEMINEIYEDVKKQKELAINAIKTNPGFIISITDSVCALDFRKYAKSEKWNEKGNEFEISFDDSDNVQVSKEDFIRYQFQYTEFSVELEEKYSDYLDELRDAQQDAADEILET